MPLISEINSPASLFMRFAAAEEVRACRLKGLRESAAMTQGRVADSLGVGHSRVSNIEGGDLERIQIDTLRMYVEAVGGSPRVEVELGDDHFQIA